DRSLAYPGPGPPSPQEPSSAMSSHQNQPDPDDMFSDTRMSFGEHIEDLRAHLIRAIVGFVIAVIISFIFAPTVLRFIAAPVEAQLSEFWLRYNRIKDLELREQIKEGKAVPQIYTDVAIPRHQMQAFLEKAYPGLKALKADAVQLDILPGLEAVFKSLGIE